MKKTVFALATFLIALSMNVQGQNAIKLNAPNKSGGTPIMQAFNDRHSDREFAPEMLQPQVLSDLLWAAYGINRPDGKRTAPTARNVLDVDVYVLLKECAYLYDAQAHALNPIATGDHRALVSAGQDFAQTAPVCIVIVTDLAKMGDITVERTKMMCAVDVGIVCQNINLAAAGLGLSTVPRATMDQEGLKKVLKLKDTQLPLMNNPVGYPKK